MKTLNNGQTIIFNDLYNQIKSYQDNCFSSVSKYDKDKLIVPSGDISNLIKDIKHDLNIKFINDIKSLKNIDISSFLNNYNEYYEISCNLIRYSVNQLDDIDDLKEKLIIQGIDLIKYGTKLLSIDKIRYEIEAMISELKESNYFKDIESISLKYKRLKDGKAEYEEYLKLHNNLKLIINSSYKGKITSLDDIYKTNDLSLIVKDSSGKTYLLNNENMKYASYGLIMDSSYNIEKAYSDKESLKSYDTLDKKRNYVKLSKEEVIGVYIITLGEKSLNSNYINAENLSQKYHGKKIYEIDLSRYENNEYNKENIKSLIDNLLDNKNVDFRVKDDNFYNQFSYFIKEFNKLKSGKYNESSIINLFDKCFAHIYSQNLVYKEEESMINGVLCKEKKFNIDELLTSHTYSEVKDVLEHNINIKSNMFNYDKIDKNILFRFKEDFYKYKDDKTLNSIYLGINVILEYLDSISDEDYEDVAEKINSLNKMDSWLIAQSIKPSHIKFQNNNKNEEEVTNFKEYKERISLEEIERKKNNLKYFLEYLKSFDTDKVKVKSNI